MKKLFYLFAFFLTALSCSQKEQEVAVSSVSLSQPSAEMVIGETLQLKAIVAPSNATDKEVVWASSKQSVASVSETGVVSALSEGSSTITATAGGKVGSCTITVVKGFVAVSSIELNKKTLTLTEGDEFVLEATVKPDDATDKTITWNSSNSEVATVGNDGKVMAIKEGEAKITAKAGDITAECPVIVEKKVIPVLAVVLSDESLDMVIGDEYKLNVTITPDDATDKTATWTSSAPTVASVNDGVVSALSEGIAVITVQVGDKKDACSVSVTKRKIPVTMVMLDHTSLDMIVGDETTLLATIIPEDATDKKIQWSTSNPTVATVQEGTVKAVKEGDAKIVAYVDGKTAECAVHVDYIPVQSITLDMGSITLYETETYSFSVTIKPDNATYQGVTWESTDNEVATVSNGKVVAVKRGNAMVKATANGQSTTCSVQVLKAVEGISLNKTETQLIVGDTETLSAQFFPEEATPRGKTSWVSSDTGVATVDENGKVTAIKEGEAKITATLDGKTAECKVIVDYIPVTSITLNKTELSLRNGETYQLQATILPDNATYKMLEWSSSDSDIVSVDSTGLVTVKGIGKETVTVKSGSCSASCIITALPAGGNEGTGEEIWK